jgi:hypothetical protein
MTFSSPHWPYVQRQEMLLILRNEVQLPKIWITAYPEMATGTTHKLSSRRSGPFCWRSYVSSPAISYFGSAAVRHLGVLPSLHVNFLSFTGANNHSPATRAVSKEPSRSPPVPRGFNSSPLLGFQHSNTYPLFVMSRTHLGIFRIGGNGGAIDGFGPALRVGAGRELALCKPTGKGWSAVLVLVTRHGQDRTPYRHHLPRSACFNNPNFRRT